MTFALKEFISLLLHRVLFTAIILSGLSLFWVMASLFHAKITLF